MPIEIVNLKVRGFRGYAKELSFTFEGPVVLLFGENHLGKSSTLNAIEWCLFGNDCAGKDTGIRERVNWEIPNRNMAIPDVLVELSLRTSDGISIIRRSLKSRPKRQGVMEELEVLMPNGTKAVAEGAKKALYNIIRSSFRDFSTTVYQHQEVIRNILTQVPIERNQAIDRLLGLSDYRELLRGIESAGVSSRHRQAFDNFTGFQNEIARALQMRQRDLIEEKGEATKAGLAQSDLNPEGAIRLAAEVVQSLSDFSAEAGIAWAGISEPQDWHGLAAFQKSARVEIVRLRAEVPEVKEQEKLFAQRGRVANLVGRYQAAQAAHSNANNAVQDFEKNHGKREEISSGVAENQQKVGSLRATLEETNAKGLLVKDGIEYLKKADVAALSGRCPLCGNNAAHLLDHLEQEWNQQIKKQVETIQNELEACQNEDKCLRGLLAKLDDLERTLSRAAESLKGLWPETSAIVGREITEKDDPLAILKHDLSELDQRLEALKTAIEQKQVKLNNVESKLGSTDLVAEILTLEEKSRRIEDINQSAEYQELESLRDSFAQWADDVEKLKDAIKSASNDEARIKITSAEKVIDDFFRKLTDHPGVTKVKLVVATDARSGTNSYEIKGPDDRDMVPILSQGDLNALALSIFLGLASAGSDRFGFVVLDDPSQSMGTHHKHRLAEVLNEVSAKKPQIIISTTDRELRGLVESSLTKAKVAYHFIGWDLGSGPQVNKS